MDRLSVVIFAALLSALVSGGARAAAPCTSMPAGTSATPGAALWVLDPASLPTGGPESFDLRSFIADGGLARAPEATGIVHDGTSAALLVFASPFKADVCFAAGTDLLFEPYEPGFRRAVSSTRQAGTWQVPTAQLMAIDGRYYAAVLVDTVTTPFDAADAVPSVAAGQCCWTSVAKTLTDQAPPVILIHGLWGNADSLSSVQQYLDGQSPWNRTTKSYVQPIQYSVTQPFDGPEPAATLYSEVTGLLADLAARHVVAGRVDIVAHSMGGLVARHYAGLPTYRSPLNRGMGAFHTVVTIDTPELGSTLAPFLLAHWNATLQAPFLSTPYTIWSAACGLFSSDNVESCFEDLGMPLAAPGAPLDSGAVYSLVPNGPSLDSTTLAPAAIPGAAWRAIDAVAPGNGALGFEVDNLIAAIYSNPDAAPTLDQLLQNLPNDAIVTQQSQTATATAPIETSFTGLSHTKAPDGSILDAFGLDDANVLASNAVDGVVGCWLLQAVPGACAAAPASDVAIVASAKQAPGAARGRLMLADRLAVTAPDRLALAQDAALPIRLAAPGLIRLVLRQHDDVSGAVETQALTVDRMSGPSATAHVTPMLFGRVTFTLTAVFADGAVSSQRFVAMIDPPSAAPSAFWGDVNGGHIYISLSVPGDYRMFPAASFAAVPGKVDLRGHVTYTLAPAAGAPVVLLGDEGTLQALRPGTARVEARFGAATDEIAVTVAQ